MALEELRLEERVRHFAVQAEAWAFENVLSVWAASQAALIVFAFLVAVVAHRAGRASIGDAIGNLPLNIRIRSVLRSIAELRGGLVFLAILFVVHSFVQIRLAERTADIIQLALNLAVAWFIVRLLANIIANKKFARTVGWIVWIVAALNIVGLLDPITIALDGVGLSLGSSRITLLTVMKGIGLLAIMLWAALFTAGALTQWLLLSSDITPRSQVLIAKLTKFTFIALAITISLSTIGVNLAALAVFAGALGVGIGIGLQHQVSNLISGLFLLLDKSIKPGDVIEVGNSFGWVHEMSARYVGIVTRDNKEILIPNDEFVVNQVVNWSHSDRNVRQEITFHVAYASDPHAVRKLAVAASSQCKRVAAEPQPVCHLTEFGESSLDFVLRFWISDPENGVTNVKGEVLLALWDAFKANNIQIPFPHRYVILADGKKPPSTPET